MSKYSLTPGHKFESIESATRAKEALHGCDIYSGCCTLKIEFAKVCKYFYYLIILKVFLKNRYFSENYEI